MSKCPHCKKDIEHLDYESKEEDYGHYSDGDYTSQNYDLISIQFKCPECGVELFDNGDDADEFLGE